MKREYAIYGAEIELYIGTLAGKKPGSSAGESSKEKTCAALSAFMKILKKNGRSWPNESDYAEYAEGKPSSKATQQNESRVRNFFLWLEKRKEKTPMEEEYVQQDLFTENEAGTTAPNEAPETLGAVEPEAVQAVEEAEYEADDETSTENVQASEEPEAGMIAPNEPESLPEPVNKRGRKRLDENGEIRKNKITVYLTDTQNEDFTALISLKHARSAADYVLGLITAEIARNEKALYFFREAEKHIQ